MNKKTKIFGKNTLYYFAFSLTAILHMLRASALIDLSDEFYQFATLVISALFAGKILMDGHTRKELAFIFLSVIAIVLLYILGAPAFLVMFFLASISIKNIEIKKIIQIDLIIKSIFLISHALLFYLDYITGESGALAFISESTKGGLENSLYFINPNNTGMIGVWIALDWLLLIKDKKLKDYIFPTLFVAIVFLITFSRTAVGIYFVYLILQFIKNKKILSIMSKVVFPICAVASVFIVTMLSFSDTIVMQIDSFLSGRIWYSITAYNVMGAHFLPFSQGNEFLETYIIDNFYIKCLVYYGIAVMLIYFIPYVLLPKKSDKEIKRISIVSGVCMLFENTTANVGLAIPYLVMADSINNGEKNEKQKE